MTTYKRFNISFAAGQLKKEDMYIACMYSYNSKCSLILFYFVYIHYTLVCTDKIVSQCYAHIFIAIVYSLQLSVAKINYKHPWFIHQTKINSPAAYEILAIFHSNLSIRKKRSKSKTIQTSTSCVKRKKSAVVPIES